MLENNEFIHLLIYLAGMGIVGTVMILLNKRYISNHTEISKKIEVNHTQVTDILSVHGEKISRIEQFVSK